MIKSFIVPVSWEVYSTVEVEADSYEEAVKIAKDNIDDIPLGDSEYVDESYKVDDSFDKDPKFKHISSVSIDRDGNIWS